MGWTTRFFGVLLVAGVLTAAVTVHAADTDGGSGADVVVDASGDGDGELHSTARTSDTWWRVGVRAPTDLTGPADGPVNQGGSPVAPDEDVDDSPDAASVPPGATGGPGTAGSQSRQPDVQGVAVGAPVKTVADTATFGGDLHDGATGMVATGEGGFALSGYTESYATPDGTEAWLARADANLTEQWNRTATFGGGGGFVHGAEDIVRAADGGYVLTGVFSDYADRAWLAKTDANGNEEWNETYVYEQGGQFSGAATYAVTQVYDGGYILAGTTNDIHNNSQAWLVKTDANGNEEWNQTYGGGDFGAEVALDVTYTNDFGFAFTGYTAVLGDGPGDALWVLKTDHNGEEEWNRTFGVGNKDDIGRSITRASDDDIVVAGATDGEPSDAKVIRLDLNGNERWNRTFGGEERDRANTVVQTTDGGFAIGGATRSYGTSNDGAENYDGWIIKTGPEGQEQWNATYGDTDFNTVSSVVQTDNDSLAFAGRTMEGGYTDGWLVRLGCVDTTGDGDGDSDGDGLCDNWETDGLDMNGDGDVDLDLPEMGADPLRTDLFVEIDYMAEGPSDDRDHMPRSGVVENVTEAFADAPVSNPDGSEGIDLHLRVDTPETDLPESQELDHHEVLNFTGQGPAKDFYEVKDEQFGAPDDSSATRYARTLTHHYGIFAHQLKSGSSTSGKAEIGGNDFIVSLGGWGDSNVGSVTHQQSTLMHEFGHNLGLKHGGSDHVNCKPNYLSVMSYSRQFPDLLPNRDLDYSRGNLTALDESNLDEPMGLPGQLGNSFVYDAGTENFDLEVGLVGPLVDWNNNGSRTDTGVERDINWLNPNVKSCDSDREKGKTVLTGHDDWANLEYNFRTSPDFADGVPENVPESPAITYEEVQNATAARPPMLAVDTNVSALPLEESTAVAVTVTVAENGSTVENAMVSVAGPGVEASYNSTGADGTATITVTPNGTDDIIVGADGSGFSPTTVTLSVGPPPVVGDSPPRDLDGDTLYEDIDGDGAFGIFDVQAFFNHFNGDVVTSNAWAFDFDDGGGITIFDVQALFTLLIEQ